MQLNDDLLTVFTAQVEERNGRFVIQLPEREIELGEISADESYQVAVLEGSQGSTGGEDREAVNKRDNSGASSPPVDEGDQIDVEIEGIGEQGDGIARVNRGYVIFVPGTDVGDRVTIEVTKTQEKFGFAEIVTPEPVTG